MTLFGLIWALLAPVLLLLPIWAVFKTLGMLGLPDRLLARWAAPRLRVLRAALAAGLVLAPVALVWWLDHRDFVLVCQQQGVPVITRTAQADGFFLDDGTANSFGLRYLQSEGFLWMEARSIYKRDAFVRYTRAADGKISETPQTTQTARYVVVGEFFQPYTHTGVMRTRILDTQAPVGAQEMARAAMVNFSGGRMKWVLGMYGSDSFPSAMSDNQTWQEAYNLVRHTLNPVAAAKSTPSN